MKKVYVIGAERECEDNYAAINVCSSVELAKKIAEEHCHIRLKDADCVWEIWWGDGHSMVREQVLLIGYCGVVRERETKRLIMHYVIEEWEVCDALVVR